MGTIPVLFINQMEISTPQDVAAYLIRFLIMNPGWTSSQIESTLLSMRKSVSTTAEDIARLPEYIQDSLNTAMAAYHPGYSATVKATRVTKTTYNLHIAILDRTGAPVLTADDFVIDNGEFKLKSEVRSMIQKPRSNNE